MRINSTLYYVLKDHLGSASVVTDANGQPITNGEQRYFPFGESRLSPSNMLTDKLFTGQREMADLGIYHYQARFYSSYITQFSQPDSIIPDLYNPQSLNRYAYVLNNPIRYNDPTGHCPVCVVPITLAEVALVVAATVFVATLLHPAVHDAMVENITNAINDWQLHDPHARDRESMEDGYTNTGDGGPIWPRPGPQKFCEGAIAECIGLGIGVGAAIVKTIRDALKGEDVKPGQSVTPTQTQTITPSPTSTNTPSCPPYNQCPTQTTTPIPTQTYTLTPTRTFTPTPTRTFTPTPTRTSTRTPIPTRTPALWQYRYLYR